MNRRPEATIGKDVEDPIVLREAKEVEPKPETPKPSTLTLISPEPHNPLLL